MMHMAGNRQYSFPTRKRFNESFDEELNSQRDRQRNQPSLFDQPQKPSQLATKSRNLAKLNDWFKTKDEGGGNGDVASVTSTQIKRKSAFDGDCKSFLSGDKYSRVGSTVTKKFIKRKMDMGNPRYAAS